jgi:deoxyribonuclease (pyrimidine dimer)
MTRINLVNVEYLADQHLMSEWREIKMIPPALYRSLKTKSQTQVLKSIPSKYTLNAGHVLFFYDKMSFLHRRFLELDYELRNRDYNISEHDATAIFIDNAPSDFVNDWTPTKEDIAINVERIVQRLNERPEWYRHWGKVTPPEYFEKLYELQLK